MRFERVNDKTVKCFISNDELEEYEISYKDFILRSDKAREMIEEIMVLAEEEVGYKPPKLAFDLQIMMVPDQGMVLTFTERGAEELDPGKELMDCLKQLRDMFGLKSGAAGEHKSGAAGEHKGNAAGAYKGNPAEENSAGNNVAGEHSTSGEAPKAPDIAVFLFRNLKDVCDYAGALPENLEIISMLYELNGEYYLYLEKGEEEYSRYSRACVRAMEFGTLYAVDPGKVEYLKEHADCLIGEQAVQKLKL